MKSILEFFITIAVLGGLGWFGWYWHENHPQEQPKNPQYDYSVAKDYQTDLSPTRNPDVPAEAMKAYDKAKDAVYESDYEQAIKLLKKAVEIKPDFTEAWYNLGATQSHYAIYWMRQNDEKNAVAYFREAVASKKKSKEFMLQGKWFEYNEEQQQQTRADVEQALENADELIAVENEPTLIEALKLWAQ